MGSPARILDAEVVVELPANWIGQQLVSLRSKILARKPAGMTCDLLKLLGSFVMTLAFSRGEITEPMGGSGYMRLHRTRPVRPDSEPQRRHFSLPRPPEAAEMKPFRTQPSIVEPVLSQQYDSGEQCRTFLAQQYHTQATTGTQTFLCRRLFR